MHAGASSAPTYPEYHFICECFFMTLKSLHLGLMKMLDDFDVLMRVRERVREWGIEGMIGWGGEGGEEVRG